MLKKATSYGPSDRYDSVEEFKRAVDGATPAVSFCPPGDDSMESSDGVWRIEWSDRRKGIVVDVLCNDRRRKPMGLTGADEKTFKRHVRRLVTDLASPR